MKGKQLLLFFSSTVLAFGATTLATGQEAAAQAPARLKGYTIVKPIAPELQGLKSNSSGLPLWTFEVTSSRDGNNYSGVMVGQNPFGSESNRIAKIPTQVVPIVITTHLIGTSIGSDGTVATTPGKTVLDPTVANSACLAPPNDVPLTLYKQSPIFKHAKFYFGSTFVGKTQYVDAFQRANFWSDTKGHDYHVYLRPLTILDAIYVNVPKPDGLALATDSLGSPDFCAPLGIIDVNWFDALLNSTIIPSLASQGVDTSSLPIFLLANVVMASPVTDINTCCILGYHGATGMQTYSPQDFDTTGLFGPTTFDTSVAAHEVAEWMNDPFGDNPVPAWGHVGQQAGCQNNLEVGDPLSGTDIPNVLMPNGYTYHLQELAFFSWFYGAPSIAVNGWFSDNDTFTTDAGPPCM